MFIYDAVCWQAQARPEKPACQFDLWAYQTVTFYSPLQTYPSSSLIRGLWLWNLCSTRFSLRLPAPNNGLNLHACSLSCTTEKNKVPSPTWILSEYKIISTLSTTQLALCTVWFISDIRWQSAMDCDSQVPCYKKGEHESLTVTVIKLSKNTEHCIFDSKSLVIGRSETILTSQSTFSSPGY